jgi:hypothetical protein
MKKFNGYWISSYKSKFYLEYIISDFNIW